MSTEIGMYQFDPQRFAELHNDIVRRGWEAYFDQSLEDANLQTWWDIYGENCDAEGISSRLVPELVEFLENALHVEYNFDSAYRNFFCYVYSLAIPNTILSDMSIHDGMDEEPPRYVLLYHVTDLLSHPHGIL